MHGFRSFRLELPPPEVLRETCILQSVLDRSDGERRGGRHPDDPLENIYPTEPSEEGGKMRNTNINGGTCPDPLGIRSLAACSRCRVFLQSDAII